LESQDEINATCKELFGIEKPSWDMVIGCADFLETAYLHEHDHPVLNILDVQIVEKRILINAEGLNVMNILLNPQKVNNTSAGSVQEEQVSDKGPHEFSFKSLRVKKCKDPSLPMKIEGEFGTYNKMKEIVKEDWVALNHTCNLPFMIFSQPVGFVLRNCVKDNKVYVYIYLSLLTNINQRTLYSTTQRLSYEDGILANMTSTISQSQAKFVQSTQIIIHPYIIATKDDGGVVKKDLILRSPLTDCKPALLEKNDDFAKAKYVAALLDSEVLIKSILNVCGERDITKVFRNMPNEREVARMGDVMYSMILFINFCGYMNQRFKNFKSYNSFLRLYDHLNEVVAKKGDYGFKLSRNHLTESNIVFLCRLLFRSLCPKLGIMVAEGNGRNYCACLAYSRCRNLNMFLSKPIEVDKELEEPNFEYISPLIPCDYVVHKHDCDFLPEHPYANLQEKYIELSSRSYKDSSASQKITCLEFSEQFFFVHVDKNPVNALNTPYEISEKWPMEFKMENEQFVPTEASNKSFLNETNDVTLSTNNDSGKKKDPLEEAKKVKKVDWLDFVMKKWLFDKKEAFFNEITKKDDIMTNVLPHFKKFSKNWNENYPKPRYNQRTAFAAYFASIMSENVTNDLFGRMNIVRSMSIYLCGLSCNMKDEEGNNVSGKLIDSLRLLVKTNGVVSKSTHASDQFTTLLRNAWMKKDDEVVGVTVEQLYEVRYCDLNLFYLLYNLLFYFCPQITDL
jgi:hypothetical protein